MTEQEILADAPEGAENWTHYDGQDYFKISNATVLDYIFLDVWCSDSKKWIEWLPVENLRSHKDIERIAELEKKLSFYEGIRNESQGVIGYHLNGDIATWDELE